MKVPSHVVVDTRDGYVFWSDGNLFDLASATAFADHRNSDWPEGSEHRTYKVFGLTPTVTTGNPAERLSLDIDTVVASHRGDLRASEVKAGDYIHEYGGLDWFDVVAIVDEAGDTVVLQVIENNERTTLPPVKRSRR